MAIDNLRLEDRVQLLMSENDDYKNQNLNLNSINSDIRQQVKDLEVVIDREKKKKNKFPSEKDFTGGASYEPDLRNQKIQVDTIMNEFNNFAISLKHCQWTKTNKMKRLLKL